MSDEVSPPDIRRIDAEIGGCDVDQALPEKIRLDTPWTAIGSRWRFVGNMGVTLHAKFGIRYGPGRIVRIASATCRPCRGHTAPISM